MIGTLSTPVTFSGHERKLLYRYITKPRLIDVSFVKDLKKAKQIAVKSEIVTIAPYLAALYSLKWQAGNVSDALDRIVYWKLSHYGLMCNLLSVVGGTPETITMEILTPYPNELPYGLGDVSIRKLTHGLCVEEGNGKSALRQVETSLAIEKPGFMRVPRVVGSHSVVDGECTPEMAFNPIDKLYNDILTVLAGLSISETISFGNENRQVVSWLTDPVQLLAITSLEEARKAIDIIFFQREGATYENDGLDPFSSDTGFIPATCFALSELYYGRRTET